MVCVNPYHYERIVQGSGNTNRNLIGAKLSYSDMNRCNISLAGPGGIKLSDPMAHHHKTGDEMIPQKRIDVSCSSQLPVDITLSREMFYRFENT